MNIVQFGRSLYFNNRANNISQRSKYLTQPSCDTFVKNNVSFTGGKTETEKINKHFKEYGFSEQEMQDFISFYKNYAANWINSFYKYLETLEISTDDIQAILGDVSKKFKSYSLKFQFPDFTNLTEYVKVDDILLKAQNYGSYRKRAFEAAKNFSVFKQQETEQYDEKRKKVSDFLFELQYYLDEDEMNLEEFAKYATSGEFKTGIENLLNAGSKSDIEEYLELILPNEQNLKEKKISTKQKILLLHVLNSNSGASLASGADIVSKISKAYKTKEELEQFKQSKIYMPIETIDGVNQETEENKLQQYLSSIHELYGNKITIEDAKTIIASLQDNQDGLFEEKMNTYLIDAKDKKAFIADLKKKIKAGEYKEMSALKPVSRLIGGKMVATFGFDDIPFESKCSKSDISDIIATGFFTREVLDIIRNKNIKCDDFSSRLKDLIENKISLEDLTQKEAHDICNELSLLSKDGNFCNIFIEENQKEIAKLMGLYKKMDKTISAILDSYPIDDSFKISFSKHAIFRIIGRNLINPKYKDVGYVDFPSLIYSIQANSIDKKGNFNIPELNGYSGLDVKMDDNNLIKTLF